MKRKILIALLAMGTIGGYASGFASMKGQCHSRHDSFERHVADLCVGAAKRADASTHATTVADPTRTGDAP
jgi:hypothetical protein